MRLLIDMNLSPDWCEVLRRAGHDAFHWSAVGRGAAKDRELMEWASREGRIVVTHDLDFGAILAVTGATGPSVLQVRTQDSSPETLGPVLLSGIAQFASELERGAIVVIEPRRAKARILPLR